MVTCIPHVNQRSAKFQYKGMKVESKHSRSQPAIQEDNNDASEVQGNTNPVGVKVG